MAKRGLLSTISKAFTQVNYVAPDVAQGGGSYLVTGTAAIGDFITDVVNTVGDQFDVDPTYFTWVEVPDAATAYGYYRPNGTTNEVDYSTPATYYTTVSPYVDGGMGLNLPVGSEVLVTPASASQPPNTVAVRPSISQSEWDNGKRWYYFGGALVASYFDPNTYSTVSVAKTELIERTKIAARNAMAVQASIYTVVTLASTSDFTTLDTKDYSAYNLSSYNTFLGTQVTNQTATINGETTMAGLYAINPEALDTDPT